MYCRSLGRDRTTAGGGVTKATQNKETTESRERRGEKEREKSGQKEDKDPDER